MHTTWHNSCQTLVKLVSKGSLHSTEMHFELVLNQPK